MEKIEDFKMNREGYITNGNFVNIVANYIRDFRTEHWFDTIKFKEERIAGYPARYCRDGYPARYYREDGKRKVSHGVPFFITFFTNCCGKLFIMFDDGEEHLTTIPVRFGDSATAIGKLVKLIEAEAKRENDSIDNWFPYVKADICIDAKVYE